MIRNILSIAVVAGAITAAAGAEPSDGFTDLRLIAPDLPLVSDNAKEVKPDTSRPPKDATSDAPTNSAGTAALDSKNDTANNDGDGADKPKDCQQRPYRPVSGCDCHVPCLDRWCVWDVASCNGYPCDKTPCDCSHGNCRLTDDGQWLCNDGCCDVWGSPVYQSDAAVRFGWWAVSSSGSPTKTGEFQDLSSSPFWDVDFISSDGLRTWNVVLSGLDNEANDARLQYYGPEGSGKLDYERYLRELDHKPLTGLDLPFGQTPPASPPPPDQQGNVITNDLNLGQDYAIRVEELDAKAHGKLMNNVTWRMEVWNQRKFGERQENATAHCFNFNSLQMPPAVSDGTGNVCHVLSQRQSIDWNTLELKPEVEAHLGNVTVDYSHTIRSFGADDSVVTREYTHFNGFSPANDVLGPPYDYALVPDNLTQIDRFKVSAKLTDCNQLYGNCYIGDNKDQLRDTHREFNGYDLRLINSTIDQVKLVGYASEYEENNSFPANIFDSPPLAPAPTPPNPSYDQMSLSQLIDYNRTRAGITATWQPYGDRGVRCSNYGLWDGTSFTSGYEYYQLERNYAVYNTTPVPFEQQNTITNQLEIGPSTRWSRSLDSYVRYRVQFIENPLIGVSVYSDDDPNANATFNTNQPQQVHNVDLGYNWSPYNNFMTTAQLTIKNSWNESQYAHFTETNYPMSFTVWYAPTDRLSFTGGYAYYSDWIDQDITLGTNRGVPANTETTQWNYTGQNHLFNINANYAWSRCVQLLCGYEWDRGENFFGVPPSPNPGVDWSLLPYLSDVSVETQRITAGFNWQPYHDMNVYFRYVYYDFQDISSGLYSGTANMFLAGATRTW